MNWIFVLIIFCCNTRSGYASFSNVGVGPRAIGMGGAYVAAGEGINGIPYNPASIAYIKNSEGYYSRSNYLAGITHNVMSYGVRFGSSDYFGVHLFYLDLYHNT